MKAHDHKCCVLSFDRIILRDRIISHDSVIELFYWTTKPRDFIIQSYYWTAKPHDHVFLLFYLTTLFQITLIIKPFQRTITRIGPPHGECNEGVEFMNKMKIRYTRQVHNIYSFVLFYSYLQSMYM